jgi:pimeloyl-ACP methyl ester carboxylesterase
MSSASKQIRTNVRKMLTLAAIRLRFLSHGWFAPAKAALLAETLFTTPLPGSRDRALRTPLGDANVTDLTIDGDRIAVYTWGDVGVQPTVLFSHGWSSFGLRIAPWVPALRAAGYAVAAFDQRGHGRSSGRQATLPDFGRTLARVAERLGPMHAVIGHSLGGAAVGMALAQGMRTMRSLLIAPAADGEAALSRFGRIVGIGRNVLLRTKRALERRTGWRFDELTAQALAPRLSTPALIVHDLGDDEVPWGEGERYARFWPKARLLNTEGLGHHRVLTAPEVIEAGLAFLTGRPVGQPVVSTPAMPRGFC